MRFEILGEPRWTEQEEDGGWGLLKARVVFPRGDELASIPASTGELEAKLCTSSVRTRSSAGSGAGATGGSAASGVGFCGSSGPAGVSFDIGLSPSLDAERRGVPQPQY